MSYSIWRLRPAYSFYSFSRYYCSIVCVKILWSATHLSIVRLASATLSFIRVTSSSLILIFPSKCDTSDSSEAIFCFKLSISSLRDVSVSLSLDTSVWCSCSNFLTFAAFKISAYAICYSKEALRRLIVCSCSSFIRFISALWSEDKLSIADYLSRLCSFLRLSIFLSNELFRLLTSIWWSDLRLSV